ncbi:major facilitator superfamily transporter [Mariannaea sp. PMI_226]|nr:major facilitator superfamily transporter [Mariannaea sp. PMI_226]
MSHPMSTESSKPEMPSSGLQTETESISLNAEKTAQPSDQAVPSTNGADYTVQKKDAKFWLIIVSLAITALLAALEATIISTALPSITAALQGGQNYVWVAGAYYLSLTALQPLFGQLANSFGRRKLLIVSIAIFVLGSGICGGSSDMNMLIAGRAVQGVGGAGINLLTELIICDLVPLRERGQYTSIIYSVSVIGSAMGPWIGGELVDKASWRWVFYINLPIGGVALLIVFLVLHVSHRQLSLKESLRKVDFAGNILFACATVGIMFALVYGGIKYPWSSWHIIVPLVLGVVSLIVFGIFETSPYCVEPAIPRQIVGNRTSVGALLISMLHSSLLVWIVYFVSVYFQAVKRHSPSRTGVDLLANIFGFIVAASVAGAMLTKYGRYRPWHFGGLIIMTIGAGLYSLLDRSTPTVGWVLLVFFFAMGCGFVMPSLLPALQADLSDTDTAAATAAITIVRSFGSVWGALIPSIIFNNVFDRLSDRIEDDTTRSMLVGGEAFSRATKSFIDSLEPSTRDQVIDTYVEALKYVWYAAIAICLAGLLCVFLEKEIDLRTSNETDFGLTNREQSSDEATP